MTENATRFTLRIDVVGLYVVKESRDGDPYHRLIAPDPPGASGVNLEMYLSFLNDDPVKVCNLATKPDGRFRTRALLPARSTVTVPKPAGVTPLDETIFVPASLGDLGLGGLRPDVGDGPFAPGEFGRALFPAEGRGEWILDLGQYDFAATSSSPASVADRFIWYGDFEGPVRVEVGLENQSTASLVLEPDESSPERLQLEIGFKETPRDGDAFDLCHAFSAITTQAFDPANQPVKPNTAPTPPHAGSSSCPPVKD